MEAQHKHEIDGITYGFNIEHVSSGPGLPSYDIAYIMWATITDADTFIDAYGEAEHIMADLDPLGWAHEQFFDNDGDGVITHHNKTQ